MARRPIDVTTAAAGSEAALAEAGTQGLQEGLELRPGALAAGHAEMAASGLRGAFPPVNARNQLTRESHHRT